ncbi:MAG: Rpn family recombination-promoting nuclease/putative transposase, partial [Myxococcaceae bacterium]
MALERFLNPKNDLAFKRIFGTEKNQDILIHFLNDILKLSKSPIQEIQFLPTVQIPEVAAQRMSAIDVLCQDQSGKRFIVEMQVESEPGFEKRAQYYAAKAYVEQRGKEEVYADLKSITFLAITSHTLFPNKNAYLSQHRMLDIETHEHDLVEFNFAFLELTKFKKKKNELGNLIDKWAYFLKNASKTTEADLKEIVGQDNIIARAF